ncbi:MAG: short-subunit dehydrogenase [Myxococcota bacterium]|jgi:short-subunit dehydrogenase
MTKPVSDEPGHIAITGPSSGIGEGLARHFAAQGWRVSLVARREAMLRALAESLPATTHTAICDLNELPHCGSWVAEAEAELGPIDVFVYNAGIQSVSEAVALADHATARLFRVNVLAPQRLARQIGSSMKQRSRHDRERRQPFGAHRHAHASRLYGLKGRHRLLLRSSAGRIGTT